MMIIISDLKLIRSVFQIWISKLAFPNTSLSEVKSTEEYILLPMPKFPIRWPSTFSRGEILNFWIAFFMFWGTPSDTKLTSLRRHLWQKRRYFFYQTKYIDVVNDALVICGLLLKRDFVNCVIKYFLFIWTYLQIYSHSCYFNICKLNIKVACLLQ